MSESGSMPGWSEFQSALSALQSVSGGGGTGSTASGGGGIGGPSPSTPVSIDVGGMSKAQTAPLFAAGFRGQAGDNAERVYGTSGQLGTIPDAARYNIPLGNIHTSSGSVAEDRTVVKPGYYG